MCITAFIIHCIYNKHPLDYHHFPWIYFKFQFSFSCLKQSRCAYGRCAFTLKAKGWKLFPSNPPWLLEQPLPPAPSPFDPYWPQSHVLAPATLHLCVHSKREVHSKKNSAQVVLGIAMQIFSLKSELRPRKLMQCSD